MTDESMQCVFQLWRQEEPQSLWDILRNDFQVEKPFLVSQVG